MMLWIRAVLAVLGLVRYVLEEAKRREDRTAGRIEAVKRAAEEAKRDIEKGVEARKRAVADLERDRVRFNDGFRRD